ncbi:DUF6314 family protein [Candidatus Jidaibacter acanthamoebae]|uniref:DUF6314 family protein n=1 Tax=Candidatus Jidaibacter acanthamoebae TaxID=86105 RepID=UPI0006A6A36B|nr:DUF6314 family protein [Candidatus Jidaibacter acanthamoeba]
MHTTKIFDLLKGNWYFTRVIVGTPWSGRVIGEASFTAGNTGKNLSLLYREDGELITDNLTLQVYKEYIYLYKDSVLEIYFYHNGKQGDLFHIIKFERIRKTIEKWQAMASHICGSDNYDTKYIFHNNKETFEIKHTVKGVKKDYISNTVFKRSV